MVHSYRNVNFGLFIPKFLSVPEVCRLETIIMQFNILFLVHNVFQYNLGLGGFLSL